ncbi:hypothetical protein CH300_00150 [Rhodococcus sp. 15-1154-1]|nr:hypothetical protein [Rhodococcus sp. 15-1154-1]OZF09827.1 hypothetical protein CH300_00150 [Rhodococcus sp. 15-1154-1]
MAIDTTAVYGSASPTAYSTNPRLQSNREGIAAVEAAEGVGIELDDWQVGAAASIEAPFAGLCLPRQAGKTFLGLTRAITAALVNHESVVFVALSNTMCRIAFENAERMIMNRPYLAGAVSRTRRAPGDESIEFGGAGSIRFSRGRRPIHCDRLIVDDAHLVPRPLPDIILDSGSPKHTLMLGSAPMPGKAIGAFPEIRHRALVLEDSYTAWGEWSVQDAYDEDGKLQIDPGDPVVIASANPTYGRRLDRRAVEQEHRVLELEFYLVERLGITDWS